MSDTLKTILILAGLAMAAYWIYTSRSGINVTGGYKYSPITAAGRGSYISNAQ